MSKKSQSTYVQKSMPVRIWASFLEVSILGRVEEEPRISVRRTAAADGLSVSLVWRILHEQSVYPYHIERVQALTPPDHIASVVFCRWFLAKCVVNSQFVDSVGF
jgi:hypothetical protein